jgi:hypothetical protein
LVVDNASRDRTVEALASATNVDVIVNDVNMGFGRACNVGAARARSDMILFVNPDAVVDRVDRACFGTLVDRARGVCGFASSGLAAFKEHSIATDMLDQALTPLKPREVPLLGRARKKPDWVSGSALLVNRDEFFELGGFDERLFLYYEDRELCARYRRANAPIRVSQSIGLTHVFGMSSGNMDRTFPYACQILSWIEYTALRAGPLVAERAMTRVRSFHRQVAKALNSYPLTQILRGRAERKADQLISLWETVVNVADMLHTSGYYPVASRLILSKANGYQWDE